MSVSASHFGELNGHPVTLFTLTSGDLRVRITDWGGIVMAIETPDSAGKIDDIVLGFDSLQPYIENPAYFGSLVGRYANRIAEGRFSLDGHEYQLAQNNGRNSLHGGWRGFDKHLWEARQIEEGIELSYTSPDGEEGYPGTLTARVRYTVTYNALAIHYRAETDKPTVLNLTNHSYFNLNGQASGNILDHELTMHAPSFTPTNEHQIPTGEIRSVNDSPFDFRGPHAVGQRIHADNEQLQIGKGYDHNWVLGEENTEARLVASVSAKSGRRMEVWTTQPGLQFYSGNLLDGSIRGKGGVRYQQYGALCLETQHFPNSPNQPNFPSTVLRPGEVFKSETIYKFFA